MLFLDDDDEDRTFGLIFSLSALLDMSDEDLCRIPKESMQKVLRRCVEECPKFQKDYEKELKHTSRFLEVWQLPQFLFCFVIKSIDLPGGPINHPSLGRILFSLVLSTNSLVLVLDP